MLFAVTGGTGFVGAHSVAALLRAGHQVRLLVRNEAAVEPSLRPLGVDPGAVDVAVADVTDPAAVRSGLRGADGVLHAAAVFSFDSRDHRRMREINEYGTEFVLDAAVAAGVPRIVYVSTVGALMPSRRRPLTPDSPLGRPRETYLASKAAAEKVARRYQEAGAPVVISYPPALLGPHDPHVGDQTTRLRNTLRGLMPLWPLGGFPVGDVRDTAELHAALLTRELAGVGRFFGPNRYLRTRDIVRTVRRVTGRALPTGYLPSAAMLPVGLLTGLVQRVWPYHIPAEYGAIYTCFCATTVDGAACAPLGIQPRPAAVTVADTVRWLHQRGLLTDRQAGALAADQSRSADGGGKTTSVRSDARIRPAATAPADPGSPAAR
jgi:nucleoside-diphosphate-sugar epimerase